MTNNLCCFGNCYYDHAVTCPEKHMPIPNSPQCRECKVVPTKEQEIKYQPELNG